MTELKDFITYHWYLVLFAILFDLISIFLLFFVFCIRTHFPWNIMIVVCIIVFHSYVLAFICAWYDVKYIIIALGLTVAVMGSLMIFALQTKFDFTNLYPYIFIFIFLLIFVCFLGMFFYTWIIHVIYCSIFGLICCFVIVYDTQMLLRGRNNKAKDNVLIGAIILYLDFCLLFVFILLSCFTSE